MKMNKLVSALLAVSLLAISPAWAEPQPKIPAQPVKKLPKADELPKAVFESIERLGQTFPQLKSYDKIDVNDLVRNKVTVGLLKRDPNAATVDPNGVVHDLTGLAILELDLTTGEVQRITMMGKRPSSTEIPVEEVIAKSKEYLQALLGKQAEMYHKVSVWPIETFELGQKKRLYSQINYKAPVGGDSGKADYVEITLLNNGDFLEYSRKTLPVAYDSWYGAELDKRVRPNDVLSEDAARTLEKMRTLFPLMRNYPVERIIAGDDGTAKIYLQKDKANPYPGIYMKFDEKGEILNFLIVDPSLNKPAADEAAKRKAADFLKSYLGETAAGYRLTGVSANTHTHNTPKGPVQQTFARVSFTNASTSETIHIDVASTGDVCGIDRD
ncbi:hypothetical protein G3578_17515 [Brevibacillus sp. SYP-B805]|nr:hypothetical protein [Brevibacillus sp. SYP-B805]